MMGASDIQLSKLDRMQHFAEQLCSSHFTPLQRRYHAPAIGLLCKLLDGTIAEILSSILVFNFAATEIAASEHFTTIFVGKFYLLGLIP